MTTVLSSKGQVVLNVQLRRSLGLLPGTVFSMRREGRAIILEPVKSGKPKGRLVRNLRSGFTVLEAPEGAPLLTTDRVRDILADFP